MATRRKPFATSEWFDLRAVEQARAKMPPADALEAAANIHSALSDPSRLTMLLALSEVAELCVSDLAHLADISLPAASSHLRILRSTGLVRRRHEGRMIYYAIRDRSTAQLVRRAVPK